MINHVSQATFIVGFKVLPVRGTAARFVKDALVW